MLRYTLTRLASLAISLLVASAVIFLVVEVAPGDPAAYMLGLNAQPDTVAALRAELGLDVSRPERYLDWLGGMLTGDFGVSYTYRTPVAQMIADRLWVSLPLALYALTLSTLIAFPAGLLAAFRRGAPVHLRRTGAMAGLAAAGLSTVIYSTFCTEDSPLFYATWYSLGILASAAIGAWAAGRWLRW